MTTGLNHRCIHARPRGEAPLARGVMLAMRVVPHVVQTGVLAFDGIAFGGTGPEAVT